MPRLAFQRRFLGLTVTVASLGLGACASTTPFDQAMDAHRWTEAANRFNADTSLQNDEHALFRAAMLYSFPARDTYDPIRARNLFNKLLELYPSTPNRQIAIDHLALLYELQRVQDKADSQERTYQMQITQLAADTLRMRKTLDSLSVRLQTEQDQSAILHKMTSLLENDLRARENQLHDLDAELAQLKAIDLKPSLRSKTSDSTEHTKKKKEGKPAGRTPPE